MGAMHKELVISVADLRYVCIGCQNCHTTVTLDMQELPNFREKYDAFTPKDCPGCQKEYDTAVRDGIDQLHRVFKMLSKVEKRVTFRGRAEEAKPSSASREANDRE